MLRLASIVGVISIVFGYSAGGPNGMVTGLVAAVGVATGGATAAELQRAGAHLVFPNLSNTTEIMAALVG